ncbi:MAG: hypothetical protein IJ649_11025 [Oscillospiraceae bacterium]|nr:hypothetical protein [Oscillospiraceae bacterium]
MNTQEILTRVNDAIAPYSVIEKAEDSRSYNAETVAWNMRERLAALRADLEAQVRLEIAASSGNLNATRTIKKLLERCKKDSVRPALHYAWLDKDGRQCICDGFIAIRLKEPLPLEPRPDNVGDGIDIDKIMPDGKGYAATPLPSLKELRAHIAIEKAKAGGKRGANVLWDFGEGKPVVNAHYLLDIMSVFPDATEIFHGVSEKIMSPLFLRSERGDAILLPVRAARSVAEVAAARQAKEDERKALEARAAELGIDPEALREREERRAKRKAQAEKALKDQLAHIRMEMALSADYALELDEFEYLVSLMDEIAQVA